MPAEDASEGAPAPSLIARSARRTRSGLGARFGELLAVSTLAIAYPLLSLFGENATFLAAHDLLGSDLIRFAVTIVVVPPLILTALSALAHAVGPGVGMWTHTTLVGTLLALIVAPSLNRVLGLDGLVSLLLIGVLAAGGIWLIARVPAVSRIVRYAAFAPILVLGLFFVATPASRLLDDAVAVSGLTQTHTDAPVVWVVFDQFPLSFMVDQDGEIIEERFPNFRRLADISTWYPNTSSIALDTGVTMPSALSGLLPPAGALPVASIFPENVFTLLGRTHDVYADEYVTQLCPDSLCRTGRGTTGQAVWADTRAVLVRTLLAEGVADRLVPRIDDRWSDFGRDVEVSPVVAGEAQTGEELRQLRIETGDDRERFTAFLDDFEPEELPTLHYIHVFHPHEPLRFLPDGHAMTPAGAWAIDSEGRWARDELMMDTRTQQYLLQAMHADHEIGRLLDRLEATSLLEDAVIVVMSDHGASMAPGTINRVYSDETRHDLLPVPMFVKAPGQTSGVVDRRTAQQLDLLPTVLDLLDVAQADRPTFDGISLTGPPDAERIPLLVVEGEVREVEKPADVLASPTIPQIASILPDLSNPYAFGPHGVLFGRVVDGESTERSEAVAVLEVADQLTDVDLASPLIPANIFGTLSGPDGSLPLAVAVNGVISGTGVSFLNEEWRFTIVVDPASLRDGANVVELYEVDGDELRLIPWS